jgi:glycosyltransferase involved in cell wall biosynthesis
MRPAKIIHFHNGSGGGVLSVIRNLLQFSDASQWENHVIYTINRKIYPEFELPRLKGAISERVFEYTPHWNFHHTARKLADFIDDENAILVAHDWMELGMISALGLSNRVVMFAHGDYDYYYDLASRHSKAIDRFIAIASSVAEGLVIRMPDRSTDIRYLRFPVPDVISRTEWTNRHQIIFIGRPTAEKGFPFLPEIDRKLQEQGLNMTWHLVGVGKEESRRLPWAEKAIVKAYGQLPNDELTVMLSGMDFYVLPSRAEGMPVSLIESMKAGVVPIVNDLPGGIRELVIEGETGFKVPDNDAEVFAGRIAMLTDNDYLFSQIGQQCIKTAGKLFDPGINTPAIEEVYHELQALPPARRSAHRVYGSRLDQPWIPNDITWAIRACINQLNHKASA